MQANDYAKWGGYVVKILSGSDYKYNIIIIKTHRTKTDVGCTHISLLKKGVLEACGFTKSNIGNYYECQLRNHRIIAEVKYANKPLERMCTIEIRSNGMQTLKHSTHSQYVISLDDLQDFVREKVGMELDVNEQRLMTAVKNNLWR